MTTHGGRSPVDLDAVEWCAQAADLGAGEILLNSMDADGTNYGPLVAADGSSECDPRWSPEGRRLAFVSYPGRDCAGPWGMVAGTGGVSGSFPI